MKQKIKSKLAETLVYTFYKADGYISILWFNQTVTKVKQVYFNLPECHVGI